jgi:hypothetical protein
MQIRKTDLQELCFICAGLTCQKTVLTETWPNWTLSMIYPAFFLEGLLIPLIHFHSLGFKSYSQDFEEVYFDSFNRVFSRVRGDE